MEIDLVKRYPKLAAALVERPGRFPVEMAERHGRLLGTLDQVWGTQDALDHLNGLLFADRHDRQGFKPGVMTELMALWELHDNHYPQFTGNGNDAFAATEFAFAREERKRRAEKARRTKADRRVLAKAAGAVPDEGGGRAAAPATAPRDWPALHNVDDLADIVDRRRQGRVAPARDTRKLLEILLTFCQVDAAAHAKALAAHLAHGRRQPLGKMLQEMGAASEEDVTRALCLQNGIPIVNLHGFNIAAETMKLVPADVARLKRAVPVAVVDNMLFLAVENPLVFSERQYFCFLTNHKVEAVMAARDEIDQCLADYGQARSAKEADEEFRHLAQKTLAPLADSAILEEEADDSGTAISQEDATVVGLVNKMVIDAADSGASDIHIERFPGNAAVRIRMRQDGRLESYSEYPASYHDAVVSRIKIIAGLDITERRRPQDGKICFARPGKGRLDLRVATIPTLRGIENAVIRLLHGGAPMPIAEMGMAQRDLDIFGHLIRRPYGLMLVCGPTGSGKTTTLHSALTELNTPERKIWTIEDPVEISQRNINQVQVNAKIGLSFACALRSFLRADPDVIMIGELRDSETTKIALEASMTGHLVLSTLHTNSSSDTVARMLDLGADPFNLAGALLGVAAQRLARQLCPQCKTRQVLKPEELDDLAAEFFFSAHQRQPTVVEREAVVADWQRRFGKRKKLALWQGRGCELCHGKGYAGRLAIFEVLEVTPEIRHLIRAQRAADEILRAAIAGGMCTLKQDGIHKALAGATCMTEVRGACN